MCCIQAVSQYVLHTMKEMIVKRKFLTAMTVGTWLAFSAFAGAQSAGAPGAAAPGKDQHVISSQDLDLLRHDIRSQKKQLIAQNLSLTDSDATKFWPIYDKFTAELVKINDKKYAALQEYADHWGSLTDDQCVALAKQLQEVDVQAAQLRAKYLPIVTQAIGGKKSATFTQLERRISMLIDLQLASKIPLVQSQNQGQNQ
jgi:Spy/CpxP family protein refolding chaperone